MHLRLSTVKRNGKTCQYAQLVESYRRPADGMPAHRVVAHLGHLSEREIANLRAALAGNRQGEQVAVVKRQAPRRPQANLRYLDLAVLLELWRQLGLGDLLAKLLPMGKADAAPADVVASLVVQRCVDPGSKSYAERWFPRTALPELLGIAPASFNNTRLHRVLDELDAATPALMTRLPTLYLEHERRPSFATLFLDVTDAYFVGHGPAQLAKRAKTKEGLIKRKIGIVLLCNERGYPLRWRVVAGNTSDCKAMTEMFRSVAQTRWVQQTPIVCDRAMGATEQLRDMAATGVRFLTSIKTTEFETYAPNLPLSGFAALDAPANATDPVRERIGNQASERAQSAGLERVADNLWVRDLGIIKVAASTQSQAASEGEPRCIGRTLEEALRLCREVEQAVTEGHFSSFNAAGRAHGISVNSTKKFRLLGRLPQDVQEAILSGEADRCSIEEILRIVRSGDAATQRARFAALLEAAATRAVRPRAKEAPPTMDTAPLEPLQVRVVAYFNPERFVEQRINSARKKAAIASFAAELNQRLASPRSRLKRAGVLAAVDRRLRRDDLLEAYKVTVTESNTGSRVHYQVCLDPIVSQWTRRRRFHGFTVLVGHRELPHSAAQLSQIYRAKDMVEKDFQVIKSVIKLRPIRHHTEAKVSAHVTVCALALLLERRLGRNLDGRSSANEAIESLSTCHLNQYRGTGKHATPVYALTEADNEQIALLRQLRLPLLADNEDLAARITPRPS